MIPLKIQLKNFLSYGPLLQTIDFSHHTLICLSGKNCHGKSALLDAMTWAIWGQARKVLGSAKPDQGLLRLGQTQMLVIFDFEFNKKIYRVRREYMETYGKPVSVLEFGMIDPQTDTFIPLTDKTIRATQEKIEQTLRLDFESFTNSAFLRQGNSNEFSKKSPKERKHILATILGLDRYEVIRKLALEKTKECTTKKLVLTTFQEKREQELAKKHDLFLECEKLNHEIALINKEEIDLKKKEHALEKAQHVINEKQKRHELLHFQYTQITSIEEEQRSTLRTLFTQWRYVNKQKKIHNNTKELEQQRKKLNTELTSIQNLFQQNLEYKEKLLSITQEIQTIEQYYKEEQTRTKQTLLLDLERLYAEQKNYQNLIQTLENQLQEYTQEYANLINNIQELQKKLPLNTSSADIIAHQEAILEKRKKQYHNFVLLGNVMSKELTNLEQKKKLIHNDNPSCPLCEQNLSAARKRFLKTHFDKDESFLLHRLNRLKRILPILKENLIAHHASLTQAKEHLLNVTSLTLKITDLHHAAEKLLMLHEQTKTQTEKHTLALANTNTLIENQEKNIKTLENSKPSYNQQHEQLIKLKHEYEEKLQHNAYEPEKYTSLQSALKTLDEQLTQQESIQKEIEQQHQRADEIHILCVSLKKYALEKKNLLNEIKKLDNYQAEAELLHKEKIELAKLRSLLQEKKDTFMHAQGSIESQKKYLVTIEHEYEQEKKTIAILDQIIDDYQTIATATGKDGIQALLIEDAIPEIEQEANHLLARLTNNQAQIFIESLRDLKKGGTKETLDIKISDQNGIRPYELFSGGEAFRIDFALRIALSKLLARRSGTALQTLIIDEGFGSQDEDGLSHIMDALHKIQDIFSKIIIVSHLPAMKDQFPTQFIVEKGVQGSSITIVELG